MKCDFEGYVTKNDIRCMDGRIIRKDAFKENDKMSVPLVWQHRHDSPENVLGHMELENREDGVYGYGFFNNTDMANTAKELVANKDIRNMSIYANHLVEKDKNVTHGSIKEVSLVLAGANPGAVINHVSIAHSDGFVTEIEDECDIFTDETILYHGDEEKTEPIEDVKEVEDEDTEEVEEVKDDEIEEEIEEEDSEIAHADEENQNEGNFGNAFSEMTKEDYESLLADLDEIQEMAEGLQVMGKGQRIKHDAFEDNDELALVHYASPYYDPVYAHEYYMAHRQLKGKHKAAYQQLNKVGRKEAQLYKKDRMAERDSKINNTKKATQKNIEKTKEQTIKKRAELKKKTKEQIKKESEQLKKNVQRISLQYAARMANAKTSEEKQRLQAEASAEGYKLGFICGQAKTALELAYKSDSRALTESKKKSVAEQKEKFDKSKLSEMNKADEDYTNYVERLTTFNAFVQSRRQVDRGPANFIIKNDSNTSKLPEGYHDWNSGKDSYQMIPGSDGQLHYDASVNSIVTERASKKDLNKDLNRSNMDEKYYSRYDPLGKQYDNFNDASDSGRNAPGFKDDALDQKIRDRAEENKNTKRNKKYKSKNAYHSDSDEEVLIHEDSDETVADILATLNEKQKKVAAYLIGMAIAQNKGEDLAQDDFEFDFEEDDNYISHEDGSEETVGDIFNTFNEKQKNCVYYLVSQALEENKNIEHSDEGGNTIMKHNIFENDVENNEVLTHADFSEIIADAKKSGSLRDAFLAHAAEGYGFGPYTSDRNDGYDGIDVLFPDAKLVDKKIEMLRNNPTDWVAKVMSGVHKSPFSRIKMIYADITGDEARARGYVTGNQKVSEVIALLHRVTAPTTIYKLQKLDRDDIIDITDFDIVAWLKAEMRIMLEEEIARQILVSDFRPASSTDRINPDCVRPILTDTSNDLYAMRYSYTVGQTENEYEKFIDECCLAMINYEGTGSPTLYTTPDYVGHMLLVKDTLGNRIYKTKAELASACGVKEIVEVPYMKDTTRTEDEETIHSMGFTDASGNACLCKGIIVNLTDYTVGADKGGAVNMFDDFDIDFNKYTYLIETRISGSLTKPKSAIVIGVQQA